VQAEYTNNVVRFGVFEIDLRAGEVRREGSKVKLQDQPFQVLVMLLEKPGQVVTREELRDRIWPAGIFVDFDKSLSKAINKIREALGDSPENSRFIETLPRRGYRFLVLVESGQAATPTALPLPSPSPRRRLPWVFWGPGPCVLVRQWLAWRLAHSTSAMPGRPTAIAESRSSNRTRAGDCP